MASNNENHLVDKDEENFPKESVSNSEAIALNNNKIEVVSDTKEFSKTDNGFLDFGFNESILNSIKNKGYKYPTPIQKAAIPELMLGRDLLGQAQTGTGKTAAFALPLIEKLENNKEINAKVLVMTPTRELATQVADSFKSYSA